VQVRFVASDRRVACDQTDLNGRYRKKNIPFRSIRYFLCYLFFVIFPFYVFRKLQKTKRNVISRYFRQRIGSLIPSHFVRKFLHHLFYFFSFLLFDHLFNFTLFSFSFLAYILFHIILLCFSYPHPRYFSYNIGICFEC
jgi:hypothetical protein